MTGRVPAWRECGDCVICECNRPHMCDLGCHAGTCKPDEDRQAAGGAA